MSLITAETRKLRTTRTTWIITAVGAALVLLQVGATFLFTDLTGFTFTGSAQDIADAIDQVSFILPIALVVGLLSMTTEFRYGTVGRTLQLTPQRVRVLLGKMVAGAGYAVVLAAVGLLIVAGVVLLASLGDGVSLEFGGVVGTALLNLFFGMAMVTIFGVALGALIRNQVVAVTTALVWFLLVETIFFQLVPSVGKWLPFTALQSVFLSQQAREAFPAGMDLPYLSQGVGLAVFLGYVVVTSVAAVLLLRFRDV
jgi:ABC-2 type transport system permease protein